MKIQKDSVKRTIVILSTAIITFSTVASAENSRLTQSNGVVAINTADGPASIDADDIDSIAVAFHPNDGDPFVGGRLRKIIAPIIVEAEE